jgi:protein involved in sex pheromone biosynthesis
LYPTRSLQTSRESSPVISLNHERGRGKKKIPVQAAVLRTPASYGLQPGKFAAKNAMETKVESFTFSRVTHTRAVIPSSLQSFTVTNAESGRRR